MRHVSLASLFPETLLSLGRASRLPGLLPELNVDARKVRQDVCIV